MMIVQVDFDGAYPVEGAKQVKILMTRYVTRALRAWDKARQQMEKDGKRERKASGENLYLHVDTYRKGLVITESEAMVSSRGPSWCRATGLGAVPVLFSMSCYFHRAFGNNAQL
jgi:hypothetical protein